MKKFFLLTMVATLMSIASMAQTVKDKIEKLSRDPKTTENAAKADANILNKKVIEDSTGQSNKSTTDQKNAGAKSGRKKKGCFKQ